MSDQDFPTDQPAVVTCGLPYATGDLHIGHLRTYVGGDGYARALRSIGQETAFVSGTDMHGTPVAVQAIQEDVHPEELALERHEQYQETFPEFDVEFDNYGHTHDETNRELTHSIVEALEDAGAIYEKEIKVAWDPQEDQPLPDRFVEGTCPYCGERARGDECDEGCQRHLEPGEIEDPVSTISGNPAEYRERTHEFFRVSELDDYLTGFLDRLEGTANAQNQPRQWIEDGLEDWCITRDLDWGFDYPGEEDLVLYVWVDAPIEYISSTKQYSERVGTDEYDWESVWKGDGEIVHIIGQDIIQHHTIFWPAMLHVAEYNEPRAVVASGFMNLDGRAFSTSRNHAIWARDYLDEGLHPDLLRYYITTNGDVQQEIDFSWEKFADRVNGELVGTLGNFCYRGTLFAHRNYDGSPDATVSEEVEGEIEDAIEAFRTAVNEYDVRAVGSAPIELARFGNEYIQRNEPWSLVDDDPDAAAQVIYDCVQLAKACAVLAEPVMPGKAEAIWTQLGEEGSIHDVELEAALEAPPAEFEEPEELFAGVEDERVEELDAKLADRVASANDEDTDNAETSESESMDTEETATDGDSTAADDLEPILEDRISFEEFQDLDLRVGRIETAEGIEGADELVKLTVDLGVETRQIVAGLKQLHDVDELPDTKVIVMANLEATELFGETSDGMVLAAGEQADLLTTYEDAVPGERVR